MDSVEGKKEATFYLLFTLLIVLFMLAFLREHNDAQSVIDIFNRLQSILGIDKFKRTIYLDFDR